ncbi:hypothetical protein P168DRAFT_317965 [Aspergillus campestris IBT 28561]|uniref:RanBP2-type domain-containing protein n=1 Tax=Aspergillus campestris (strain IBT 28561) TaxID=1392248 RepID=A0A2I1D4Y0_ASPC2|nr:uncharacterized protein P168DRAFT_317965 [Aspergillus campestris IBT 28561]PKY04925.1 hypothetical protein P168DRAFT_317965 [Aspergillus campestris IBT 28561]
MKFSKILAVIVLPASIVHAAAVAVDQESTGLEARGCKWKNCDDCYENDKYCVFCNNGGGIGVSCIVWLQDKLVMLALLIGMFQYSQAALTPQTHAGPPESGGSIPAGPPRSRRGR